MPQKKSALTEAVLNNKQQPDAPVNIPLITANPFISWLMRQNMTQPIANKKPYTQDDVDVEEAFRSMAQQNRLNTPVPSGQRTLGGEDFSLPNVTVPHVFQPGPIIIDTEEAGPIDKFLRRFTDPEMYSRLKSITRGPSAMTNEVISNSNAAYPDNRKRPDPNQPANTSLMGLMGWPDSQYSGQMYLNPNLKMQSPEGLGTLLHELMHHYGGNETAADMVGILAGYGKGK